MMGFVVSKGLLKSKAFPATSLIVCPFNSISKENSRSRYSTEYLKKIIKGGKLSDTLTLWLSNDYPLKVEYKVIDRLSLTTILAPRVSND